MAKITISEAVGLTGTSESTIRRDIKSGKVSSEKDDKGQRRIDIAELQRVYDLTPPPDTQKAEPHSQKILMLMGEPDHRSQGTTRTGFRSRDFADRREIQTARFIVRGERRKARPHATSRRKEP